MLLVLLFSVITTKAQRTFMEQEFIAVVKKFHPVAKQAVLNIRIAKANVLSSRGAFDPRFQSSSGRKDFDGINYYDVDQYQLQIPTWYGVDVYAGIESVNGQRINPEETKGSISYVGFSVPVLQNLLMDKRRAALQQAKVLVQQSEAEQRAAMNDLLQDALYAYWNWWQQYRLYKVADSISTNVYRRFQFVKTAWQLGDRPAIDTVEAQIQVQSVEMQKNEAFTELAKAQLELSVYLWNENNTGYDLPADVVPQTTWQDENLLLNDLMSNVGNHPLLQVYNFKLDGLSIEKRLRTQALLPRFDLKYNQLVKGNDPFKTANAAWFQNNYRFGFSIAMPLRLSEGRGELLSTKLKIETTRWEQANKSVQLQTKVKQTYTELQQIIQQINLQTQMAGNYATLQRGEEVRFQNGESSLFLVNAREQKTLEAQQKLASLQAKKNQLMVSLRWSAGMLF
jgi:outer membrane protein TolC